MTGQWARKKQRGIVDYDLYTTIQRWRKIYGLYYYFYKGRKRGQGGERGQRMKNKGQRERERWSRGRRMNSCRKKKKEFSLKKII